MDAALCVTEGSQIAAPSWPYERACDNLQTEAIDMTIERWEPERARDEWIQRYLLWTGEVKRWAIRRTTEAKDASSGSAGHSAT